MRSILMLRRIFFLSLVVTAAGLLIPARAQGQGAYHVGYTHVGPGGVQHWGSTGVAGPYGAYGGAHYGAYGGGGGAYHAGYGYGARYGGYGGAYGGYHYGGGAYGGYHYGGFRCGG